MGIKAQEVRVHLRGKVDPSVSRVIEAIAEEQRVVRQQLVSMAQDLDQMTGILAQVVDVAHNMKSTVDKVKRMQDDDESSTIEGSTEG